MKRERLFAAAAGAAGLALVSSASGLSAAAIDAVAQNEPAKAAPAGEAVDAAAVAALVEKINAQVAALAADASQADVEAAVLFAIDQAQQPDPVVAAALAEVKANATGKIQTALANVEKLRGRLASGTGGIGGNGADGDLSFGPQLNGSGGGSSNYTPATPA